jgi:hypothetical protein
MPVRTGAPPLGPGGMLLQYCLQLKNAQHSPVPSATIKPDRDEHSSTESEFDHRLPRRRGIVRPTERSLP